MGNEASSGAHTADAPPRLATQASATRYIGVRMSVGGKKRTAPEAGAPEAQRRRLILDVDGHIVAAEATTIDEGEISPTLWAALEEAGGWPTGDMNRIILVAHKLYYDDVGDRLRDLSFLFAHFRPSDRAVVAAFYETMRDLGKPAFNFLYAKAAAIGLNEKTFQRLLHYWELDGANTLRLLANDRYSAAFKGNAIRDYLYNSYHYIEGAVRRPGGGYIWLPTEMISNAMKEYFRKDDENFNWDELLDNLHVYLARDMKPDGATVSLYQYHSMHYRMAERVITTQPRRGLQNVLPDHALRAIFGSLYDVPWSNTFRTDLQANPRLWVTASPELVFGVFLRVLIADRVKLDLRKVADALSYAQPQYAWTLLSYLRSGKLIDAFPDEFDEGVVIAGYTTEDVIGGGARFSNVRARVLRRLIEKWDRPAAELVPIVKQNLEFGLAPLPTLLAAWIHSYNTRWRQRPDEWSPDPAALRILQLFLILGARVGESVIERLPDEAAKDGFAREQRAAQEALVETIFQNLGISAEDVERWRIAGAGSDVWLAIDELSLGE